MMFDFVSIGFALYFILIAATVIGLVVWALSVVFRFGSALKRLADARELARRAGVYGAPPTNQDS